jgi:hypothetical protein
MDLRGRIDDWRQRQPVILSREEAVPFLVERGLVTDSAPAANSLSAVAPPPDALSPVTKLAPTYAELSIYQPMKRPLAGYTWEEHGHDAFNSLNTKQSKRLIAKLIWLVDQYKAAGKPTTLRKLVEDVLTDFVRRELKAWGVPSKYAD